MLHVSDSKLYTIRQQIVRQIPLPEEMTVQLDAVRLQELLQEIERVPEGEDFDVFVARLPRRELNNLFGLLLVVEAINGESAARQPEYAPDAQGLVNAQADGFAAAPVIHPGNAAKTEPEAPVASAPGTPTTPSGAAASLRSTLASFFRQAKAANAPVITPAVNPEQGQPLSGSAVAAATGSAAFAPAGSVSSVPAGSAAIRLPEDPNRLRERIYRILERRATLSLAQTGWTFYQQHFFQAELAEAMSRISRMLVAKGENEPFLLAGQSIGYGEDLPARLSARWLEDLGKPAAVLNGNWSLARKLSEMAVMDGSRFTTLLLHAFFTRCPLERTAVEASLFSNCLELATTDEQASLLTALYGDYRLEPAFEHVNRAVLTHCRFPRKADSHPVWRVVSQQVRQHFRQWALIDMIRRHAEGQARKLSFYQPLLMRVLDCVQLAPDVLLLEFSQFYLVDHRDFSHQVMFYDRPTLEMARDGGTLPEELAIPSGYLATARDLILSQNRASKVLLKLEEVNLLFARDFIESMMNPPKRKSVI